MPFIFEKRPYQVSELASGLLVGKNNAQPEAIQSAEYKGDVWEATGGGEDNYYEYLQLWFLPFLHEQNLEVLTVKTDPIHLPATIRQFAKDSKVGLIVNTLPKQPKYIYTTTGLHQNTKLEKLSTDEASEPNNQFACVPTALYRLGVINSKYFDLWKEDVRTIKPIPDSYIPNWTGHMIAIQPADPNMFRIGDQYGAGYISNQMVIEMAAVRNNFQGESTYHLQVIRSLAQN